jgi:hypothetical protein
VDGDGSIARRKSEENSMNSLQRIGILLVVPLLALAGCRPDPSPASPSGPATSPSKSASIAGDAEAFTECVRKHGVSDFPGVTVLSDGRLQLNSSSSFNQTSDAYRAAAKACASTLPSGTSLPADPSPPSIAVP